MKQKTFGMIGLGRMGGNLAFQAIEKGWRVAGFNRSGPTRDFLVKGLEFASSLAELKNLLPRPRVVLLYVPAGPTVDELLIQLCGQFEEGDIVIDGGNSYWGDSIRRQKMLKDIGLDFIDLGTSGGVSGARYGACFMAGGLEAPVQYVQPLLSDLAVPDGFTHAGPPGAGHYAKLVHNGIEFGMLQAIGEGMELLEKWPRAPLQIGPLLHCWSKGSVIRSWLIELMERAYREHGGLQEASTFVEDTGEVNWLVSDALHMEVPIPVIAQSVFQLFVSRDEDKTWARAINMMRHGFGGHPLGPSPAVALERKTGRLGDAFLQ